MLSKFAHDGTPTALPSFHQPCDTEVYHQNVTKFVTFKSVLQSYFKKKTLERARSETYWAETYERQVTSWLKKVDAKTIKKKWVNLKLESLTAIITVWLHRLVRIVVLRELGDYSLCRYTSIGLQCVRCVYVDMLAVTAVLVKGVPYPLVLHAVIR